MRQYIGKKVLELLPKKDMFPGIIIYPIYKLKERKKNITRCNNTDKNNKSEEKCDIDKKFVIKLDFTSSGSINRM